MLKKLIPVAVAAVAMLLPVAPAAAWSEVCVEFPEAVDYEGDFSLTHLRHETHPHSPRPVLVPVNQRTSEQVSPGGSECVDISNIPVGEGFAVHLTPAIVRREGGLQGICRWERGGNRTRERRHAWQITKTESSGALWFEAGGSEREPACAFSRIEE